MFKLVVSNTVLFDVRGSIRDDKGVESPFDFQLEARRETQAELTASQETDRLLSEYLGERVTGWKKVADESGAPIPFSAEALQTLFAIPGMSQTSYRAYLAASGVKGKEKN